MTLAELIADYRASNNLSQRQMGAQCGLSTGYISLVEKEINPQTGKPMVPTLTVLNKLAKGMNMTIDELISICDDMPVNINEKTAPIHESGLEEEIDLELAKLILSLSPAQKQAAMTYLHYLAEHKDT